MAKTDITVNLSDCDGNAFSVLGTVIKALRREGRTDLIEEFRAEATSGDYDHLLMTCMDYVEVE